MEESTTKPRKGYYCLVQYNPDPSRAETVNIGVLLFCPERRFIAAKTSRSNRRIERFFKRGSFNPFQVNEAKRALEERLQVERDRFQTLDDLQKFIDTRANNILLTSPRVVRVEQPEADLQELYEALVGGVARREARTPSIPLLEEIFRRLAPTNRVRVNETFTVPKMERRIRIRYSYQNGVLNLVRPEAFSADRNRSQDLASLLTIEGRLIEKHSHESGTAAKLIIVSAATDEPEGAEVENYVAPIFAVDGVRFVRRSEVADFAQRVEAEILAHE